MLFPNGSAPIGPPATAPAEPDEPSAQYQALQRQVEATRMMGSGQLVINPHSNDPADRAVLRMEDLVRASGRPVADTPFAMPAFGVGFHHGQQPPGQPVAPNTPPVQQTAYQPVQQAQPTQTPQPQPVEPVVFDLGAEVGTQRSRYASVEIHGRFLVLTFDESSPYPSYVPPIRVAPKPPIVAYLPGHDRPVKVYNFGVTFPLFGRIVVVLPMAGPHQPQPEAGPPLDSTRDGAW